MENKKNLFRVKCKLISTVYTQEIQLNTTLRNIRSNPLDYDRERIREFFSLSHVSPSKMNQFPPLLLNYAITILFVSQEDGKYGFELIMKF